MDEYIVVSNDGWYAKRILEEFPNYQGIDRFPWPLCKEELNKIANLPDKERAYAEHYANTIAGMNVTGIYCNEFTYTFQYAKLCKILKINANIYLSRLYYNKIEENQLLEVDDKKYLFIGYDYILKDTVYSSIVHEKHLCDKIEELKLNQNGLLGSLKDAKRFANLREQTKIENNEDGFEAGSDGVDFQIRALFKYKENV